MFLLAISPGEGFEAGRWAQVIHAGIDALMLRERSMGAGALLEAARWVLRERPGLEVWINGRLDVALASGCGLHAPERYPQVPPSMVALSRPLHRRQDEGDRPLAGLLTAQQLLVSPVFAVPGKGPALGREGLHALLEGLPDFPGRILALGGLQASTAAEVRHPRLAGVAVIRALWGAPEPAAEAQRIREAWEG